MKNIVQWNPVEGKICKIPGDTLQKRTSSGQ